MASGDDLLRALGGVTNVSSAAGSAGASGRTAAGSVDFRAMLERARAGTLESGLPVTVAPGTGLDIGQEQLARLGPVIDRLHASGASHAMVEIDGKFLVVDVMTRQVRSEFKPGDGGMVEGIDAVVSAAPAEVDGVVGVPGSGVLHPSLAAALERLESERDAA
jgi:hypothetical protein